MNENHEGAPFPVELRPRFEPVRRLGAGGFGEVFLAIQQPLGRPVALKLLRCPEAEARERFRREARILSEIRHPSISTLVEFGEVEGTLYFVTEYEEGCDLRQLLRKEGRLSWPGATSLMLQVLDGLEAAHAHGLVHRDIKPENIHVTRTGRIKLLDFGSARTEAGASLTEPGSFLGTLLFAAPEQFQGEPATARSDLYAAGLVYFEALCGENPFAGLDVTEVMERKLNSRLRSFPESAPEVPPALRAITLDLLQRDPELRPATASEVIRRLEPAMERALDPAAAVQARTQAMRVPVTAPMPVTGDASPRTVPLRSGIVSRRGLPGLLLLGGMIGLAALVVDRPPGNVAVPGPLEITFDPRERSMEVRGPPGSRVEVRSLDGVWSRNLVLEGGTAHVSEITPSTTFVASVHGGASLASPITTRSPPAVLMGPVHCSPGDGSVVVDFRYASVVDLELTVKTSGEGDGPPPLVVPAGHGIFHQEVVGLTPATTCSLTIASPQASGGLRDHRFRTADRALPEPLRALRRLLDTGSREGLIFALPGMQEISDTRILPLIERYLGSGLREPVLDREMMELDAVFRDPGLARRLAPDPDAWEVGLSGPSRLDTRSILLEAGHPDVKWTGRSRLGSIEIDAFSGGRVLRIIRSADLRAIEGLFEWMEAELPGRVPGTMVAEGLARVDPERARALFLKWIDGDATREEIGLAGLGWVGRDEDIPRLVARWDGADRVRCSRILDILARLGSTLARETATRFLDAMRLDRSTLWELVRSGVRTRIPDIEEMLKKDPRAGVEDWSNRIASMLDGDRGMTDRVTRLQVDCLLALALLGSEDSITRVNLPRFLEDRRPDMVRAATWALARLGHRESGPILVRRIAEAEPGLEVLWAVGELRIADARVPLEDLIRRTATEYLPWTSMQRELATWALERLDGRSAESGADRSLFLFPYLQCVPTGIRLWPEDTFDVELAGRWGPAAGPWSDARSGVAVVLGKQRLRLSPVLHRGGMTHGLVDIRKQPWRVEPGMGWRSHELLLMPTRQSFRDLEELDLMELDGVVRVRLKSRSVTSRRTREAGA